MDENYRYQVKDIFTIQLPEGKRKLEDGTLTWTGQPTGMARDIQSRTLAGTLPSLEPLFADKKAGEAGP